MERNELSIMFAFRWLHNSLDATRDESSWDDRSFGLHNVAQHRVGAGDSEAAVLSRARQEIPHHSTARLDELADTVLVARRPSRGSWQAAHGR